MRKLKVLKEKDIKNKRIYFINEDFSSEKENYEFYYKLYKMVKCMNVIFVCIPPGERKTVDVAVLKKNKHKVKFIYVESIKVLQEIRIINIVTGKQILHDSIDKFLSNCGFNYFDLEKVVEYEKEEFQIKRILETLIWRKFS